MPVGQGEPRRRGGCRMRANRPSRYWSTAVDATAASAAVRAQRAGGEERKPLVRSSAAMTWATTARHGTHRRTQGEASNNSSSLYAAGARALLTCCCCGRRSSRSWQKRPPANRTCLAVPLSGGTRPFARPVAASYAPWGPALLQSSWMRASVMTRSSSSSCFIFWPVERRSSAAVSGWAATDERRSFHALAVWATASWASLKSSSAEGGKKKHVRKEGKQEHRQWHQETKTDAQRMVSHTAQKIAGDCTAGGSMSGLLCNASAPSCTTKEERRTNGHASPQRRTPTQTPRLGRIRIYKRKPTPPLDDRQDSPK